MDCSATERLKRKYSAKIENPGKQRSDEGSGMVGIIKTKGLTELGAKIVVHRYSFFHSSAKAFEVN